MSGLKSLMRRGKWKSTSVAGSNNHNNNKKKKFCHRNATTRSEDGHFSGKSLLHRDRHKHTSRQWTYFLSLLVYISNASLISLAFVCLLVFLVFHILGAPSPLFHKGREKVGRSRRNVSSTPGLLLYKALNYFLLNTNKHTHTQKKALSTGKNI